MLRIHAIIFHLIDSQTAKAAEPFVDHLCKVLQDQGNLELPSGTNNFDFCNYHQVTEDKGFAHRPSSRMVRSSAVKVMGASKQL